MTYHPAKKHTIYDLMISNASYAFLKFAHEADLLTKPQAARVSQASKCSNTQLYLV